MINIIALASYGFAGGEVGKVLNDLESAGFFSYILPFLLIYAIIFGILSSMKIFENNKAINSIISFAIALMALQTGLVSDFFVEITPFFGIGLFILLIVIIFLGFFSPKSSAIVYTVWALAAIILINILLRVAENMNSWWFSWWQEYKTLLIGGVVIIIILIILSSTSNNNNNDDFAKIASERIKKLFGGN